MAVREDDGLRPKAALMAYVAYRVTNTARNEGGISPEKAHQIMAQLLHDAVVGDQPSTRVVDAAFVKHCRR